MRCGLDDLLRVGQCSSSGDGRSPTLNVEPGIHLSCLTRCLMRRARSRKASDSSKRPSQMARNERIMSVNHW